MFYMPITVLGPSLAIDQVAGFDYRLSSAAIFLVCIAYSSLGGLKGKKKTNIYINVPCSTIFNTQNPDSFNSCTMD